MKKYNFCTKPGDYENIYIVKTFQDMNFLSEKIIKDSVKEYIDDCKELKQLLNTPKYSEYSKIRVEFVINMISENIESENDIKEKYLKYFKILENHFSNNTDLLPINKKNIKSYEIGEKLITVVSMFMEQSIKKL